MLTTDTTQVTVEKWPEMVMPEREIQETLAYLAYKTGKPVRVRLNKGDLAYSDRSVIVCSLPDDQNEDQDSDTETHKPQIVNENGKLLAIVDHNCIMLAFDLLDRDDDEARTGLAQVAQEAFALLDFDIAGLMQAQRTVMFGKMQTCLIAAVSDRLASKKYELGDLKREVEAAYHQIVEAERRKPCLEREIKVLKRISASKSRST